MRHYPPFETTHLMFNDNISQSFDHKVHHSRLTSRSHKDELIAAIIRIESFEPSRTCVWTYRVEKVGGQNPILGNKAEAKVYVLKRQTSEEMWALRMGRIIT